MKEAASWSHLPPSKVSTFTLSTSFAHVEPFPVATTIRMSLVRRFAAVAVPRADQ